MQIDILCVGGRRLRSTSEFDHFERHGHRLAACKEFERYDDDDARCARRAVAADEAVLSPVHVLPGGVLPVCAVAASSELDLTVAAQPDGSLVLHSLRRARFLRVFDRAPTGLPRSQRKTTPSSRKANAARDHATPEVAEAEPGTAATAATAAAASSSPGDDDDDDGDLDEALLEPLRDADAERHADAASQLVRFSHAGYILSVSTPDTIDALFSQKPSPTASLL